jgi:hypothetical protein
MKKEERSKKNWKYEKGGKKLKNRNYELGGKKLQKIRIMKKE